MQGTRLGPYEILEQLGAGGMGEVWLAQDTRLGRKVAVKVLPPAFASDPERLARFEQEARAAAALNHPHIAAVYDVGADGEGADRVHYMVQEHLEGRTLRDLLGDGKLPPARALELAREIGEALVAAHAAGIVHRDLKPENVFVSPSGHAKVLDFGLAKLTETAAGPPGSQSMSPTVLGTQAGAIMGTAGYMAPEQVNGEEVDQRADLFALGCVLYEMATGRQPFAGRNVYDTLSRIVDQDPTPVTEVDGGLPAQLQWILRKCLAKSPAARYQGAGDLVVDLKSLAADVDAGRAEPAASGPAEAAAPAPAGRDPRLVALAAFLALLVGVAGAWILLRPGPSATGPVTRFTIEIPEDIRLPASTHPVAISPDGTNLVFLQISGGDRWLELRRIGQLESRVIPGTEGVRGYPFFSPDGRWLGFERDSQILRVSLEGEPPQRVADAVGIGGATWTDDDRIVFGDAGALMAVPAAGGEARVVVEESADTGYYWPDALPGGDTVLAVRHDGRESTIVTVDLRSGAVSASLIAGDQPRYLRSGHLAFGREGFLFAAPFDLDTLSLTGEAIPVVENVRSGATGQVHYAVSDTGTLVYSYGAVASSERATRMVWLDMSGNAEPLAVPPARFDFARLSPDGTRVAAQLGTAETGSDIYVYELSQGGASQRLTATDEAGRPVWSPDGQWIYFSSHRNETAGISRRRSDFTAEAEAVVDRDQSVSPEGGMGRDGRRLAVQTYGNNLSEIGILDVESGEVDTIAATDFLERWPRLSPDGRLVAWVSNETGGDEIYVLDLETRRRRVASSGGGRRPVWSPTGDHLYYDSPQAIMAVEVTVEPDDFRLGSPAPLFVSPLDVDIQDMDPTGEHFLAIDYTNTSSGDEGSRQRLIVALNWFEEVRQRFADLAAR